MRFHSTYLAQTGKIIYYETWTYVFSRSMRYFKLIAL